MSANDKKPNRERTEPTLGNLDQMHASPPPATDVARADPESFEPASQRSPSAPPPYRASRRGWLWPALVLLLIVVAALAWTYQGQLRALFPRTQLNSILVRADQALAAGHLDGRDGTSARELYATANALEPDNELARRGLHRVADAELARASHAIQAGQLDAAQTDIANARALLGGGKAVDAVQQALDRARNAQPQNHTDVLTERAQQALAAGKLDGPDGAAVLYTRALDSDPSNAVARHGLDKVADALAAQARHNLDNHDLASASSVIQRIGDFAPSDADLPALRASLAQAQQQAQASIQQHLDQGQADLRAGKFTGADDDNALAQFQAVLAVDADNAQALAGTGQVAQALILRANAALDSGDAAQAGKLLDAAEKLAPQAAGLATARARIGSVPAPATSAAQVALTPSQQVHVTTLLQQAEAATRAGDIMLPPGVSAYDLYRAALAMDGNNPAARHGLQQLPARTTALFEQALRNRQLSQAYDLLGTLSDLAPGDPAQANLRVRLADAWLDRAETALDQGDRTGAHQALTTARRLHPASARLHQLESRAQGG